MNKLWDEWGLEAANLLTEHKIIRHIAGAQNDSYRQPVPLFTEHCLFHTCKNACFWHWCVSHDSFSLWGSCLVFKSHSQAELLCSQVFFFFQRKRAKASKRRALVAKKGKWKLLLLCGNVVGPRCQQYDVIKSFKRQQIWSVWFWASAYNCGP